jgi:hypothetical protein
MNSINSSINLILFSWFVFAFLLDLTDLPLQRWGRLFIYILALYHLLRHWKWIATNAQSADVKLTERREMLRMMGWSDQLHWLLCYLE